MGLPRDKFVLHAYLYLSNLLGIASSADDGRETHTERQKFWPSKALRTYSTDMVRPINGLRQ